MAGSGSLGTLSIDVLANIANMVSDLGKAQEENKKAAKKFEEDWKESINSVAESFKTLAELAGIGISIEWVKEIVSHAYEAAESIDHLTQSLGLSAASIQTLSFAAGKIGSDLEVATNAFAKLERSAELAAAGSKQQVEAFRAIGISASELTELLKNPDELLQTVAQHLNAFGDGAGKTAVVMQLFGRNAQQIIPLLNQLGSGFEELSAEAASFGLLLSGPQLKALQQTQEEFNLLGQQINGVGNELASALAPALQIVVKSMGEFLQSEGFKNALADIGVIAKVVADNLNLVGIAVEALVAKAAVQWLIGAAAGIASMAREAVIGVAVWGEMTGAVAAAGTAFASTLAAGELFTAGMTGLLGVIGGIPGLIALLGVGIYELATHEDDAAKAADTLRQAEELLKNVTAESVQGDIARAASLEKVAQEHLDAARAALSQMEAEDSLKNTGAGFGEDAALAANSYALLEGEIGKLRTQIQAEQNDLDNQHAKVLGATQDMHAFGQEVIAATKAFSAGDIAGNMAKFVEASNQIHATAAQAIADGRDATIVHAEEDAALAKLSTALSSADSVQVNYNAHVKETKAVVDKSGTALLEFEEIVDKLAAKTGGPYVKAIEDFNAGLIHLQDAADKAAIAGGDVDKIIALWQQGEEALQETLSNTIDKIIDETDIVGQLSQKLDNESRLVQATGVEHQILEAVIAAEAQARKDYNQNLRETAELLPEERADIESIAASHAMLDKAIKDSQAVEKQWQSIFSSGLDSVGKSIADFATGGIKTWKDFGKSLVSDAKQFIGAIIQEFLKLTVFNGIINSLFGLSGGNALPTGLGSGLLGSMFGGGGGGGGLFGGLTGGGSGVGGIVSNFTGGGSGGGLLGNLFGGSVNPGSILGSADSNTGIMGWLFGSGVATDLGGAGVLSGAGAFAGATAEGSVGGFGGFAGYLGDLGDYGGSASAAASAGTAAGSSFMSTVGPMLGGFMAGYQLLGGGAAGIAGGIGLAAAAYFIPVVGWIAGAASLINSLTGGGLFGTSWKPTGASTSTLDISGSGAAIENQIQESKKKALFGGTSTKWKDIAPSDQQTQAANDFYTAENTALQTFAQAFGQSAAQLVSGTFTTSTDKKGNVTTSSTVLGQTYTGESSQQFGERIEADSFAKVLDGMGIAASQFVSGLQSDADKLLAGIEDLATATSNAQADIKKGISLLGDDHSIADVMNEVIKLNDGNEKLADEYVRLQQETQGFHAILDTMGQTINKTGADFVEFADSASKAAGGIQNLTQLANQFAKDFYSAGELTANSIASLKTKVASEFSAIGEDPTEGLAKFRQDFEAALPTMSPEDLVKWYQAGVDLASLNDAVGTAADNYAKFIAQFNAPTGLTQFEQAMVNLGSSIADNVKKADDLAVANGQAAASAADIGKIITASVAQGVQMLQQLQKEAASLAGQLFGTPLDQLKKQLADAQARVADAHAHSGYDLADQALVKSLTAQIAQADAQDKAQQEFSQAAALLGDLGQIGAITGQSLQDFAGQLHIPLDKFASMLGTDAAGLQKDFQQQEDMAKAALDTAGNTKYTNELLADILAASQGKPLPYSTSDLAGDATGTPVAQSLVGPGKLGAPGTTLPGLGSSQPGDVAAAISDHTDKVVGAMRAFLDEVSSLNRTFNRYGLVAGRAEKV